MTSKPITVIFIMLLLAVAPLSQASPQSALDFKILNFSNSASWIDSRINGFLKIKVENDTPFDALNDINEPRGTQNWEESQSSFLIFPGIVLCIIAALFFFNRE